jgi:hypothetical protein
VFSSSQKNKPSNSNLVRLHPKSGGVDINFNNQRFHGVSSDVFLGLDLNDYSRTYQNTRKLNLSISVDPCSWKTEDLLSYLTHGELQCTSKCTLHGDKATGLLASPELLKLLKLAQFPDGFQVDGLHYVYDSIGVACNPGYESVSHRQGNAFKTSSSHFEIKFLCQTDERGSGEYLCLNIHLMPDNTGSYGKIHALERLKQAINLFYAELGLKIAPASYKASTSLRTALNVTLDNYENMGFACIHGKSQEAIENNTVALKYTKDSSGSQGLSLFDYISTTKMQKQHKNMKKIVGVSDDATADVAVLPANDKQSEQSEQDSNAWSKKLTF